jgi:hypothetical protein
MAAISNPTIQTDSLDRFFDGLQIRLEAAQTTRKELDRYLGSGFNLLEIFYPDENRLSYVISRLLDPNGGHGQGSVFLEKFFDLLPEEARNVVKNQSIQTVKTQTEFGTDNKRRIDIVVSFGDDFAIGIENKPWAEDQGLQLKDYAKYLESRFKGNFVLIYLSGYTNSPSDYSISKNDQQELQKNNKLVSVFYNPDLVNWLNACASVCEAEKIRWFLRDFATWVENRFQILEVKNEGAT